MRYLRHHRFKHSVEIFELNPMVRPERIAIVGAGPAGIAAAATLVDAGWRPTVIDEQGAPGGQIYRSLAPGMNRSYAALYGSEAEKAFRTHERFATIKPAVDYLAGTIVWGRERNALCIVNANGLLDIVPFDYVIAATGAIDRQIPVPGWTTPGVYTLGGAQIALKHQLAHIGRRTVFAGTGALLYLVAWQYMRSGGSVACVLDSSTKIDKLRALPAMLSKPRMALRGAQYAAMLRAYGVPVHDGARLCAIEHASDAQESQLSVKFAKGDRFFFINGDAVALGYGLKPESQLAELFDVKFEFDASQRLWLPGVAADGSTSDPLFYMAGDGCNVLGADAASLMGERAAWTLISRMGISAPKERISEIDRSLENERRFSSGLRMAFQVPKIKQHELPDETIVCRCEVVTAGELRKASTQWDTIEINRIKALTRCGMGRCQGRMCGSAAAEIIAAHREIDIETVGRLRTQQPLKPIPLVPTDNLELSTVS